MNNPSYWYLLAYDIRCKRRLQRTHKFLRTQAYALQESVFAWYGNAGELDRLQTKLMMLIDPRKDDVRGYRLQHHGTIRLWGNSPFIDGIFDNGYPPYVHIRGELAV
jgi:CRISPR-associated endonuclease Cas2